MTKYSTEREIFRCAHEECNRDGILPIKSATLCRFHAERFWQAEADKFCADLNLHTLAEKREYIHDAMRAFANRQPGRWWADEILARNAAGLPVTTRALEMAREVMR